MGAAVRQRMTAGRCLAWTIAALALAVASAPAAAASVTIGSADISTIVSGGGVGPSSASNLALPGRMVTSPVNGTITSWGMRSTSVGTSAQLRRIRSVGGDQYAFISSGPLQTGLGNGPHILPVSLPISQGDGIALTVTAGSYGRSGAITPIPGVIGLFFGPAPPDGGTALAAQDPGVEYLLQASIEPGNDATLVSIRKNKKKGTATLTESVPNPGTLVITEGPVKPQTIQVGQPGEVKATLRPNKRAKTKLLNRGKVAGGIDILFTPSFGTQSRDTTKLVLKLNR